MASRTNSLSESQSRQLLERILSSGEFRQAESLRQFLLHITECAFSGRKQEADEASIARAVFGRLSDFDPTADDVVRREARELRVKLQRYFAGEGREEPVVLELPEDSYLPVIVERPAPAAVSNTDASVPGGFAWLRPLLPASVLLIVVGMGALFAHNRLLLRRLETMAGSDTAPRSWLWDRMFDAAHATTIVVADSGVMEYQELEKRRLTLGEYLQSPGGLWTNPNPRKQRMLEHIASRQLTSMADVVLSADILGISRGYSGRTAIRFARAMDMRDFRGKSNLILLASQLSNPWVELFEAPMNYRLEYEPATSTLSVHNLTPLPGEPPVYTATTPGSKPAETFGVIGLHPNLSGEGRVLLIAGATVEGTEAAGEFLIDGAKSKQLADALVRNHVPAGGYFEALIKVHIGTETPRRSELVACRALVPRDSSK